MTKKIKTINKTFYIIIIIFFFLPLVTQLSAYNPMVEQEEAIKHLKRAFYMAENDLFDARMILRVKDKIQLTTDQEKKIEDLMLQQEAYSIRNSAEIKIKELRFASFLKSGEMKRNEMAKHIREISKEKTDMIVRYMNYLLDVKTVLTPAQMEKLKEIREEFKKQRKEYRKERRKDYKERKYRDTDRPKEDHDGEEGGNVIV